MPQTRKRLVLVAAAAALALAFTGCTSASEPVAVETSAPATSALSATATPEPTATPSPTREADADYLAAVASYPRDLPEGYTFPDNLIGADAADKWWWCSQIDAAWEAYFPRDDEATALIHLRAAADVDPGSYGGIDIDPDKIPMNNRINRTVRYIDGGVDSQYLEYTAHGCWRWAKLAGAPFPPLS